MVAGACDHPDIVLDENDAQSARLYNVPQNPNDQLTFGAVETSSGFIDQKDLGLSNQCACELHTPLNAIRQVTRSACEERPTDLQLLAKFITPARKLSFGDLENMSACNDIGMNG